MILNSLPEKLLYHTVVSHIALLVKGKQNSVGGSLFRAFQCAKLVHLVSFSKYGSCV